jgi:hypothetical protein
VYLDFSNAAVYKTVLARRRFLAIAKFRAAVKQSATTTVIPLAPIREASEMTISSPSCRPHHTFIPS